MTEVIKYFKNDDGAVLVYRIYEGETSSIVLQGSDMTGAVGWTELTKEQYDSEIQIISDRNAAINESKQEKDSALSKVADKADALLGLLGVLG